MTPEQIPQEVFDPGLTQAQWGWIMVLIALICLVIVAAFDLEGPNDNC